MNPMPDRLRISLANKCQLLFGAAVILILGAALAVVSLRMQSLVDRASLRNAQDLAVQVLREPRLLEDQVVRTLPEPLGVDDDRAIYVIPADRFDAASAANDWLKDVIQTLRNKPDRPERFRAEADEEGNRYYRYARGIYKPGILTGWLAPDTEVGGAAQTSEDQGTQTLRAVLLIDNRDRDAATARMLNRIYIVAAGLFAGLLAIATFWFITTRIVLSPVRLLTGYAKKVSEGDLSVRSDINTGDEFEQLSDMFNLMLENLKTNQDKLTAANKTLDLQLGELADKNVSLYEANKMKGEFLANVSHELRTPLNSIVGFAEVLQETLAGRTGPVDEKRKRYSSNIITSSRRLLDLINDLLDLAKIEAGRMELSVTRVPVRDTLEGLLNLMSPQAEKRGVALRLRVEPDLPILETDAGKLQQIVFNFLSNAIKFTPSGGIVTLNAGKRPLKRGVSASGAATNGGGGSGGFSGGASGGGGIAISVTDTGPGISEADQERIFDKFTQLDPSVTRTHGGTGLGLTISRDLARMLQGRIEVVSAPGKGATFTLLLPVTIEADATPLMPEPVAVTTV